MKTQATIMKVPHGEADGGRSHGGGVTTDSMGPTNSGGAGGGGARGGDREPKSQGPALSYPENFLFRGHRKCIDSVHLSVV